MKSIRSRSSLVLTLLFATLAGNHGCARLSRPGTGMKHGYNGRYAGAYLNRVAFPIGGIGAGMFCLEGTGAISHVSVRNRLQFTNEPAAFAALCVKGDEGNAAKVLEGPVPTWKVFGPAGTGNGAAGATYGLPRFEQASFLARFPFGVVTLSDPEIPLDVEITGWSPFIPTRADESSLPVGALEYRFGNPSHRAIHAVFSYNAANFMRVGGKGDSILPIENGFILRQEGTKEHPEYEGGLAIFVDNPDVVVDHCWFKGGWWDALTLTWRNATSGLPVANPPLVGAAPGASLYVPLTVQPGEEQVVRLMFAWYVPKTDLRLGKEPPGPAFEKSPSKGTAENQNPVAGFAGRGLVNTYDPRGDTAIGTLTSPEFELTRPYIQFLIGGGNYRDKTCLQLLIGDEVVRSATGNNSETLEWTTWEIHDLKGKAARLRIVDSETGAWGHILVDEIVMTERRWENIDELTANAGAWGEAVVILNDFEGDDYGDWIADGPPAPCDSTICGGLKYYVPWYAGRFDNLEELSAYWRTHYEELRRGSVLFRDAFYDTTLPPEAVEAIAANLTILKSPTVLRQSDGRLWCFEGCGDDRGCCHGSCTHVWNYAQALPHLFPDLERSLRQTEFFESQDDRGHQAFRSALPIRPVAHDFHAAADGQLGGIMKVHRDWRISGDSEWLAQIWPRVAQSLDYCIATWDPRGRGVLEEPHHNTYDIEYWGPNGHCTSFYLGALRVAIEIGSHLGEDVTRYGELLSRGREYLETRLYHGEYFIQVVQTEGLNANYKPLNAADNGPGYAKIVAKLNEQGPKYQYGTGCLSDGVLGVWMAQVCGVNDEIVDPQKVRSHLRAIHRHNLRHDLFDHANPQRPAFALGSEGGLLLCTWPKGGEPELPFVYSNEIWTGIEYSVASHLIMSGMAREGLEIVRIARDRYDGRVRNPFNEYECGHWYARALSSYALLQALTGVRYDAVDKTLYIGAPGGGDFRAFLSTATGFGAVGMTHGRPYLDVKYGTIEVRHVLVNGRQSELAAPPKARASKP